MSAFPSLLTALLHSHVALPRLAPGAYTAIFQALREKEQSSEASSSSKLEEAAQPGQQTSEGLVDAILDAIWAVDAELDARKDLHAIAAEPAASESGGKSFIEIVAKCRGNLAHITRELIVSLLAFALSPGLVEEAYSTLCCGLCLATIHHTQARRC